MRGEKAYLITNLKLLLLLLSSYLALYPVNGFFIGKTYQGDPVAHYLNHCMAIGMNKISGVDSIFLGIYLYRLNPWPLSEGLRGAFQM